MSARTKTGILASSATRKLPALIDQGKARIVKEFKNGEPTLVAISSSGSYIGIMIPSGEYRSDTISWIGSGAAPFRPPSRRQ